MVGREGRRGMDPEDVGLYVSFGWAVFALDIAMVWLCG